MIQLSFSTINNCLQPENSHNWLNKQMGQKPEDKWYYHEGEEAHRLIQQHVCGKELDTRLAHIKKTFEIVEEEDFDERCKFEFQINEKYKVIGFYDGKNDKEFLEIKTSSVPWSLNKFKLSMQRKLYALSNPDFKQSYLITCKRRPEDWDLDKPKLYKVPVTDKDREDALNWIKEAIDLLESGDFSGGLENGACTNPRCYYGRNCQFK